MVRYDASLNRQIKSSKDKDNNVLEFRARWVIYGNRQRPRYDFIKNLAPITRGETIRLFLSIIAKKGMILESVYIKQPTGFEKGDILKDMGFEALIDEPCILIHKQRSSLSRGVHSIFLCQKAYAEEIIVKEVSKVYLPIKSSYKPPKIIRNRTEKDVRKTGDNDNLPFDESNLLPTKVKAYIKDVDKSRPDIAIAINKLQRRSAAPRREDQDTLKQLNRYVKGSIDLRILLGKEPTKELIGFVDASF
ncbi:hypothetical protein N7517_010682 [Penicillium concentricum]|uniref:Uncharacterized protein n=1 Tax=Penicillium concentricum TaxID=293559 RepID=A0A9W9R9M2_9EURO|nr:uncharacterized protein N7517_010682 [Penicillium concentricum]KAJ5356073.1 hypothetical protein N7517_010682 [Penicillium concentricum]